MTQAEIIAGLDNLITPLAATWREFVAVTGCTLIAYEPFRIRVKCKRGYCANKAQMFDLYVDGRDLYCVDFMNSKGKVIDKIDGVFVDELERVFRDHTAMATRFPRCIGIWNS